MPWAQGVGRSNRPAPTNKIKLMRAYLGLPQESAVAVAFVNVQQNDPHPGISRPEHPRAALPACGQRYNRNILDEQH
jgi:hypothetical protein